jgi:ABC-type antimicrobial peptide transport system permease subunit
MAFEEEAFPNQNRWGKITFQIGHDKCGRTIVGSVITANRGRFLNLLLRKILITSVIGILNRQTSVGSSSRRTGTNPNS